MQLYDCGIRRRLAPMLKGDRRRLELAYSLLFTLPGTPVIRYGDELGMGDDLSLPERNSTRTPMQWANGRTPASRAPPRPSCPSSPTGPTAIERVNDADQRRDAQSMLNWTERMIRMRKEFPRSAGATSRSSTRDRACWRCATTGATTRSSRSTTCSTRTSRQRLPFKEKLTSLFDSAHSEPDKRHRHHIILEPYGYRWYRAGGLGYILDRRSYQGRRP